MKDFLEQLAELEVREPPPEFDRQLHQRVNRTLLVQHLVDLLLGAIPGRPCTSPQPGGMVAFTVTGKFRRRQRAREGLRRRSGWGWHVRPRLPLACAAAGAQHCRPQAATKHQNSLVTRRGPAGNRPIDEPR